MILIDPWEGPGNAIPEDRSKFRELEKKRRRITCIVVIREMQEWLNQFLCPECKGELVHGRFSMICHKCVLSYRSLPNDDIAKEWQ